MKFLNQLFAFYVNSSIHVALAVLSLVMVTCLEFEISLSNYLWAALFFGAISGYNFVKYATVAGLHHRSLASWLKTIQVFSVVSAFILCFLFIKLKIETLATFGVLGFITLLYAVPFINKKNLRMLGGLKVFIVALVWAACTVIVPLIASQTVLAADHFITFFQRFFFVLVLIIPFEIRDLKYDNAALKTIPQSIGIKRTKRLGLAMLIAVILLEGFKDLLHSAHFYSLIITCFITGAAVLVVSQNQKRYTASFWVEGISIVYGGVYLLLCGF